MIYKITNIFRTNTVNFTIYEKSEEILRHGLAID